MPSRKDGSAKTRFDVANGQLTTWRSEGKRRRWCFDSSQQTYHSGVYKSSTIFSLLLVG